jgi:hypothetical protein
MQAPSEESLAAAAAEAEPLRRLQAFTRWVGAGRSLTQTGRITLADARELVGLLDTGDVIDPEIGDRVFRTKSSEELRGITLVAEWAKASGLVRRTSGKLVAVKKQAGLLERPLELWARMFEVFPRLGEALCVAGWGASLLRDDFEDGPAPCWRRWPAVATRSGWPRPACWPGRRWRPAMCWMTSPRSN